MMEQEKAFPAGSLGRGGMNLRDYFAAAVLPTIAGKFYVSDLRDSEKLKYVVESTYMVADAMMKERNNESS